MKSLRHGVGHNRPILSVGPEVWIDRVTMLDAFRDLKVKHIHDAREKQERHYNKGEKDLRFNVGDLVMRRTHVLSNAVQRFSKKLAPKFEGPFEIKEIKFPTIYILRQDERNSYRIPKYCGIFVELRS